jgi:hypothetical protein
LDFSLFKEKFKNKTEQENIGINIFFIIFKKYLFSNFILLNNCNIINFINNKILFDKRFFVFYKNIFDIIETNISIFLIIGRGKYIFKNILNNISGPNIKNFIFYNIYIIERFYINIISKTRFRT